MTIADFTLFPETSSAVFNETRTHRYRLTRQWHAKKPFCAFCMLNPSTADETKNDPTIQRCIGFAMREGCGGLIVVNLFALRSTDPAALYDHPDPIGKENNEHLHGTFIAFDTKLFVCAWGCHGELRGRGNAVLKMLYTAGRRDPRRVDSKLRCLGTTKDGHPKHPLYLKSDTPLQEI